MRILYFLFLILALILESTIIKAPLVLSVIAAISSIEKVETVFLVAFITGFVLDVISFSSPGIRSLFLISFVFMIYFYERKFEINNLLFVVFSSVVGSFIYIVLIYPNSFFLLQMGISVLTSVLVFIILSKTVKKKLAYE